MKIIILNEDQVQNYQLQLRHVNISVRSPGAPLIKLSHNIWRQDTLFLQFHDIDGPIDNLAAVPFSREQAQQIIDFFSHWRLIVDTFVINCEAGISRSSAIGAALCKIAGEDDSLFFKQYIPNRYVYRTILEEYGKEG